MSLPVTMYFAYFSPGVAVIVLMHQHSWKECCPGAHLPGLPPYLFESIWRVVWGFLAMRLKTLSYCFQSPGGVLRVRAAEYSSPALRMGAGA